MVVECLLLSNSSKEKHEEPDLSDVVSRRDLSARPSHQSVFGLGIAPRHANEDNLDESEGKPGRLHLPAENNSSQFNLSEIQNNHFSLSKDGVAVRWMLR